MIEQAVEQWHRFIAGDVSVLADVLADDVVFYSPVVFTPQRGKAITSLMLIRFPPLGSGGGQAGLPAQHHRVPALVPR